MATQGTKLTLSARDTSGGSRAVRRLRRSGRVPGVLYGGDREPVAFHVDARELRIALAARGAVLDLHLEGQDTPAVLKDSQVHPVRAETQHVDLLRVNLNVAIAATVPVHLDGTEQAPGVVAGGVLDQVTHTVNVEALPGDIPEEIRYDVSGLEMNDTVHLSALTPPRGVTITDDLEETVLATLTPTTVDVEADEAAAEAIEEETGVVGQGGGPVVADPGDVDPNQVPTTDGTPE